jgi:hypothetical protein
VTLRHNFRIAFFTTYRGRIADSSLWSINDLKRKHVKQCRNLLGCLQVFKVATSRSNRRTYRIGRCIIMSVVRSKACVESSAFYEYWQLFFLTLLYMLPFSCCTHRPWSVLKITEKPKLQISKFHIYVTFSDRTFGIGMRSGLQWWICDVKSPDTLYLSCVCLCVCLWVCSFYPCWRIRARLTFR